ncbi:PadR family transcriptional regulator [Rathayibacter soli]|uniref:PadR family transcriptional regulator n=1 Tax=Rathayibacter soli TaxID=3144168 RepID=UPI0027E4BC41|nr:PadR family transcriptional regulator [Glaciibacter superstes]
MATAITPLGIASLALLAEQPMHPYEMYQTLIKRSEDRIVKVRPGSLYHTVDRLVADGLVRAIGTEREGNRPERTTYEITESGQLSLTERVAEMLATRVNHYPEFPLAIGEAHNLPRDTVVDLLQRRLAQLRADLEFVATAVRAVTHKELPRKYWLEITYQKAILEAEIGWIESFVAELESGDIDW